MHDVTIAAPIRSDEEERGAAVLQAAGASMIVARVGEMPSRCRALACLPTHSPSSMGYFYSPRLAATIRAELARERYDLICVHCSSVAPYVADVTRVPKLLDFGDMDSQKWLAYAEHRRVPLSFGYRLESRKLQRAELELLRRFDFCTCSTPDELATLRSFESATPSGSLRNGVDLDYFAPTVEPYDANTICFLGRMDYFPNQECMVRFCTETLPPLRRRRPNLRLLIVGADPPSAVRRLMRWPGVVVTGSVPDVRPYARQAALSIAPLRIARGTQNKVLESLAMGIPVVCSPLVARGVDAIPGEHLLTVRDVRESVDAIARLLEHPAERRRLSVAGRARMQSHHGWDHTLRHLDRVLDQCRAAHAARAQGRGPCNA
jgi:sugar transferase (PEP-CTERM/EpsH1 system associated)